MNSFLFALFECNSSANSDSLTLLKFSYTTFKAAIFSDTNKIFFPTPSIEEIIFVMVWLLPDPGGPCKQKDLPFAAYCIALSCEESQFTTGYSGSLKFASQDPCSSPNNARIFAFSKTKSLL